MAYSAFLRAQAAALVEQFFAPMNIGWIGVPDTGWLTRRQSLDGGQIEALPGWAAADAVVWRDSKGRAELWVKPEAKADAGTGAYARAWRLFAQLVGSAEAVSEIDGRKLAVDHL